MRCLLLLVSYQLHPVWCRLYSRLPELCESERVSGKIQSELDENSGGMPSFTERVAAKFAVGSRSLEIAGKIY